MKKYQIDLTLDHRYEVRLNVDIEYGHNIDDTVFTFEVVEYYDHEQEVAFRANNVLPWLREDLELLTHKKFGEYSAKNFNDVLAELADDDWLSEQQRLEDLDNPARYYY